jgi:hypothetical protein
MFSAPFRVCFSDYRILFCGHLRKCAILILRLPLLRAHGTGDLGQTHLADIAGCHTQGVQRFRGIEIHNTAKILIREVWRRINSATDQKHIAYAAGQECPIPYLQIQVIQIFQKASVPIPAELRKIVLHVVLHRVPCGGEERRRE